MDIGLEQLLGIVGLTFVLSVLFTIAVQPFPMGNEVEEILCEETNCNLQQENLEYCTSILKEERETAVKLWDDYFVCVVASDCQKDRRECKEYYEIDDETIEYSITKCYYAENYEEYYNKYETGE